jgi:hypothetical protein
VSGSSLPFGPQAVAALPDVSPHSLDKSRRPGQHTIPLSVVRIWQGICDVPSIFSVSQNIAVTHIGTE